MRQAFAGIEITISKNGNGSWNKGDVMVFMKEISSDGNLNTVYVDRLHMTVEKKLLTVAHLQ